LYAGVVFDAADNSDMELGFFAAECFLEKTIRHIPLLIFL